jgi:hypothetical protein
MNDFYKALETKREGDISHYGIRGMRWGVRIDYDDKKDNQGRIISSKPTAVLENAPDPKRANKRAVKLARAKMKEYGFENPEIPSAIAGQKYEDFQKLIFAKKMEALPKDATSKDLDDAFTESIVDSANMYMCSKVIVEAEKRAAKKGGKK